MCREARLNTHGQKFDPESLYEPIKFETLQLKFGQQILILDPLPYIGLFGPSWSELSPRVTCAGGGRLGRR